MGETGAAIGITTTTTTVSSLSVASRSLASATPLGTLMDTDTAATTRTVVTPTLTTGVGTTATVTTVAVITVPLGQFTLATPTVQALALNRAWCACSSDWREPGIIEDPSMESWGLAPATPFVPTSTIMAQGPIG